MAEGEIKPRRKPPRHPLTGPVQTDTMPDSPSIKIGPEAGEMKKVRKIQKSKATRSTTLTRAKPRK